MECQYGNGGYACCEGGPCKADEQNNDLFKQEQGEPVVWYIREKDTATTDDRWVQEHPEMVEPLYLHPQPKQEQSEPVKGLKFIHKADIDLAKKREQEQSDSSNESAMAELLGTDVETYRRFKDWQRKQEQGEPVTTPDEHPDFYCWTWDERNGAMWRADYAWSKPKHAVTNLQPLYTTPQQCTWVGLTEEEIESVWVEMCGPQRWAMHSVYARKLEAKLKEKNT